MNLLSVLLLFLMTITLESKEPKHEVSKTNKRKQRRRRQTLIAFELMEDFAKNTSLHGLRYVTERGVSLVEKLFWIVTFLISLSMCLFLIHNVWVKWQTSPVIVALSEQLVSVGEVPFPSVMICPQIKAKRSVYNFSAETAKMRLRLKNISSWTEEDQAETEKFEDVGIICWIENLLFNMRERDFADRKIIDHLIEVSPNISDIIRGCIWQLDYINCKRLFRPVLTQEGVCFTMNSLAASEIFRKENIQKDYYYLNTSEPSHGWSSVEGYTSSEDDVYPRRGKGYGAEPNLKIILQEQFSDRDGLCNGINRGYKVYLQHPADMPQASLYYYAALPKQRSSFALKFSILNTSSSLKDYPPETRQCYFPAERQLRYFLTYTANNCMLECLSNYTIQHCGCVAFYMPYHNSSVICRQAKLKCVKNALERYATGNETERCLCLPSCVGIQYDAEVLKTNFEANNYLDAFKAVFTDYNDDESPEEDNRHLTQIDLYYKEARFVSMRRSELFGLTDFLANCGGLLGLFLGFSILSLVEIFYFITLRLGCTLRRDAVGSAEISDLQLKQK